MQKIWILVFALIVSTPSFADPNSNTLIVVDAGSTGSKIHVYQKASPNNVVELFHTSTKPGLSNYADNPQQAGMTLLPLLQQAAASIDAHGGDGYSTPVVVYSTAGMRLLTQQERDAINHDVKQVLMANGFHNVDVETIPGWKEAVLDWLTINHLTGKLNPSLNTRVNKDYDGVLDLGGASAEIAFVSVATNPNIHELKYNGQRFSLYARSDLHLGLTDAIKHLSQYGDAATCYPRGYDNSQDKIDTAGNYDDTSCRSLTDKMVASHSADNSMPAPQPRTTFYAVGGYYYTLDFFKAPSTVSAVHNATMAQCSDLDWQALQAAHPATAAKYTARECFDANLIQSMLGTTVGYGFSDESQWKAVDNVQGQDIDWPLGAALFAFYGDIMQ